MKLSNVHRGPTVELVKVNAVFVQKVINVKQAPQHLPSAQLAFSVHPRPTNVRYVQLALFAQRDHLHRSHVLKELIQKFSLAFVKFALKVTFVQLVHQRCVQQANTAHKAKVIVRYVLKAFIALKGHLIRYSVRLGHTHLRRLVFARSVLLASFVQYAQQHPSSAMQELIAKLVLASVLHVQRPSIVRRDKTYRSRVHSELIANLVLANV